MRAGRDAAFYAGPVWLTMPTNHAHRKMKLDQRLTSTNPITILPMGAVGEDVGLEMSWDQEDLLPDEHLRWDRTHTPKGLKQSCYS